MSQLINDSSAIKSFNVSVHIYIKTIYKFAIYRYMYIYKGIKRREEKDSSASGLQTTFHK